MPHDAPPRTPDGRYIVVRGRLWRSANPHLPEKRRAELAGQLHRDIRIAGRKTQGVVLFRVAEGEKVVSVTRLGDDSEDNGNGSAAEKPAS